MKNVSYKVRGTDLSRIYNSNEIKVIQRLEVLLDEIEDFDNDGIDIQDIFALSLNNLPSRYRQPNGIMLKDPVTDEMVDKAIRKAIKQMALQDFVWVNHIRSPLRQPDKDPILPNESRSYSEIALCF